MGAAWFDEDIELVRIAILGSTGSIGTQALEVARAHPDRFQVVGLSAGSDHQTLFAQAREFGVKVLGLAHGASDGPQDARLFTGPQSAEQVAEESGAQVVLNALVGAAGLGATLKTIANGQTLALANKESLVAGGELVMSKVMPGKLRPVDSEHSALWQLLEALPPERLRRVFLTGSGGPFRGLTAEDLKSVSVEQALKHPVWQMGNKITIDSATLMNKGLEVIEAHFLFGLTYDEIEVVIHPQGRIHGMVEAMDGEVFAHAAVPDMRLPIALALSWPDRLAVALDMRMDWGSPLTMTFEPPDLATFRCLALAYQAGREGGTYPAVLNAANEACVGAFLDRRLDLVGIWEVIEQVLDQHTSAEPNLEAIMEHDAWARSAADALIETRAGR
jgi:1-deoxy-D-xylulose-5-phosphate reductoisomerase